MLKLIVPFRTYVYNSKVRFFAIKECIKEDILKNFLKSHRGEVLGSLLTDFDRKKYERTIFEDAKEEDIQLLTKHLKTQDSSLSEEEAESQARLILTK